MEVSGQLYVPASLTQRKEPPSAHLIGGWVGPRPDLDVMAKRKNPFTAPVGILNPSHAARSLVAVLTKLTPPYKVKKLTFKVCYIHLSVGKLSGTAVTGKKKCELFG
jgi:hypothetical protein